MKTVYNVKKFTFEPSVDKTFILRKMMSVVENVSWLEAKKIRNENKGSWIV